MDGAGGGGTNRGVSEQAVPVLGGDAVKRGRVCEAATTGLLDVNQHDLLQILSKECYHQLIPSTTDLEPPIYCLSRELQISTPNAASMVPTPTSYKRMPSCVSEACSIAM
uniref:Uncharacterized protein n=1 Tax=Mesocestoides corti TaxID=53468 RepID=A0A5K3EK24_MESCO